jgi:acyl carrier protein
VHTPALGRTHPRRPDISLIDFGYDSLKFIELILIMGHRFTVAFDDEDLNYHRFGRVSNLVTYIESRAPAGSERCLIIRGKGPA